MSTGNYFAWRSEVKDQFQALTVCSELKPLLQQFTESSGFDYFAFLIQHPVPFTRPRIHLHSTYPELWVKRYEKQNYYAVDPVLAMCQRPGRGLMWTQELSLTPAICGVRRENMGYRADFLALQWHQIASLVYYLYRRNSPFLSNSLMLSWR